MMQNTPKVTDVANVQSADIGNEIYVQGATQPEYGGQYLLVPEGCQSLMFGWLNL